jgi:hypothetical protein
MKNSAFNVVIKRNLFNFLKRTPPNQMPLQNNKINNENINVNKDKKEENIQESKINKYYRDNIKKYDGRLN